MLAELDVADDVVEGLEEPLGLALALDARRRPRRRSRAGRGRRSGERSTSVCRVSPYVAIAAIRTVPCSSVMSSGSRTTRGAGAAGLGDALSTSGTSSAMSTTPSPCLRWWSTSGLSGSTAPLMTNRIEPERSTKRLVVAVAVLGAGVGLELHAPRGLVVVRGLGGVADDEDDRVPPGDREDVLLLVVLDEADELLELLEGQVGLELLSVGQVRRRHGRQSWRAAWLGRARVCNSTPRWHAAHSACPVGKADMCPCRTPSTPGSIDLFAAEPRIGVLEASRAARASPGAPCRRGSTSSAARGDHGRGRPELDPAALGYPVTAFCTLEIRQGRGPRPRRRAPGGDPRGARGAHDHRRRATCAPGSSPAPTPTSSGSSTGSSTTAHVIRASTVISLATRIPLPHPAPAGGASSRPDRPARRQAEPARAGPASPRRRPGAGTRPGRSRGTARPAPWWPAPGQSSSRCSRLANPW